MTLLALDTASAQCAAALLLPDGATLTRREPMPRGQSERLLPLVAELLAEAGIPYAALTGIAVTTGPGSFTGLRVALAAAQGLALALSIPAVGIDSFRAFDCSLPEAERVTRSRAIVIESRRLELYWQMLDASGCPLAPASCAAPAEIAALLPAGALTIAGDGAKHLRPFLPEAQFFLQDTGPAPETIGYLGIMALAENPRPASPSAFYLRPPDARHQGDA